MNNGTTSEVLAGLELIRAAGLTNMFDRNAVMDIASDMCLGGVVAWIVSNSKDYIKGIMFGFEEGE